MADSKSLIQEFKEFITTGDLVGIAVAFVMAAALGDVIKSFITNIFNGILALFMPKSTQNLNEAWIISDKVRVGAFISSVIAFIALAFVVFLIVKAYRKAVPPKAAPSGPTEAELLTEIRDLLRSRA